MKRFSAVAIIAAYNEADIIGQVVGDFIAQGVAVWLIDHASTDGTVEAAGPYLGRGLHGIERFPPPHGESADAGRYPWVSLLRRKEALAAGLDADWFIHADADEFRESPWDGLTLLEAIERVDATGYNAIDAARFDFWPVDDRFRPGDDVRASLRFCEPAPPRDRLQIRCWKRSAGPVDLAGSGGHEVRFADRRVFPIRFVIRHYPIRSQAHGERKVFVERRPRYQPDERNRGWHVQYDAFHEGASFVRDPATLTAWDPNAVRLDLLLHHRGVEAVHAELAEERRARELEVDRLRAERQHAVQQLDAVRGSRSWRWTAPLRAAFRAVSGRPE